MHRAAFAGAMIFFGSGLAHADDGCKPMPTFTPARNDVTELRCFPQHAIFHPTPADHESASPLSLVLAGVGTAGLGAFIGFGLGGKSQQVNGVTPHTAESSVRVDFAVANVSLAVGLAALVTSIVLIVTHH
jgi:hypothetical protein